MKRKTLFSWILKVSLAVSFLFMTSCATYFARFSPPVKQEVNVILKENDFKVIATNLRGEAKVDFLFGQIPLGDNRLYSIALGDLYSKASKIITNKPTQLTNFSLDEVIKWKFLITSKSVVFRADLIEFVN